MSKLLIVTQVYENYAWREDGSIGTGADAYWKAKCGSEYVVKNVNLGKIHTLVEKAIATVEEANDYFIEKFVGWEIVEDDYLTDFEKFQLEYEGKIEHPAKELVIA